MRSSSDAPANLSLRAVCSQLACVCVWVRSDAPWEPRTRGLAGAPRAAQSREATEGKDDGSSRRQAPSDVNARGGEVSSAAVACGEGPEGHTHKSKKVQAREAKKAQKAVKKAAYKRQSEAEKAASRTAGAYGPPRTSDPTLRPGIARPLVPPAEKLVSGAAVGAEVPLLRWCDPSAWVCVPLLCVQQREPAAPMGRASAAPAATTAADAAAAAVAAAAADSGSHAGSCVVL